MVWYAPGLRVPCANLDGQFVVVHSPGGQAVVECPGAAPRLAQQSGLIAPLEGHNGLLPEGVIGNVHMLHLPVASR